MPNPVAYVDEDAERELRHLRGVRAANLPRVDYPNRRLTRSERARMERAVGASPQAVGARMDVRHPLGATYRRMEEARRLAEAMNATGSRGEAEAWAAYDSALAAYDEALERYGITEVRESDRARRHNRRYLKSRKFLKLNPPLPLESPDRAYVGGF